LQVRVAEAVRHQGLKLLPLVRRQRIHQRLGRGHLLTHLLE